MLRPHYEVETFHDGQSALEAARRGVPPDLVLSDMRMPRLDGLGLLRALRADARLGAVPVIILTAFEDDDVQESGLEAGANDFLMKPFRERELLTRLRVHLQTARKLRAKDELARLILERARDYAIFTLDTARRITSWNPGAEAIFGYPAREILGQSADVLFTPEDRANGVPEQEFDTARREGRADDKRWHLRKDGIRFWADGVMMSLREGGAENPRASAGPSALKILRDMTTMHEAQEARRRAEERLRLVVSSVQDYGIFTLDPEGRVASWNEGAARLAGYTEEEILGQDFAVFYPPEVRAAGATTHELASAAAEGRFQQEQERVRKGGERYWADELTVSLRDDAGGLIGFAKICRDLSERKRGEDERERLLSAEQAARAEAEAANQTKDRFLAILSHELRTPLMPVTMALHFLRREAGLTSTGREAVQIITRNVETEGRIINDLLDVSRIASGKLELTLAPLSLHDCVRHALEVVQSDFEGKALHVSVALEAPDHVVHGDERRLEQVFWNLLKNAAKFTPEGGQLCVRSANPVPGTVHVEIKDTGIGLRAEVLPFIFEAFAQADVEVTRRFGGLGLGLAISRANIDAHGGRIDVASAGLGQGAAFSVELPVTKTG